MIEGPKIDFQEFNIALKYPEAETIYLKLSVPEKNQVGFSAVLFAQIIPFRAKAAGPAKFEIRVDNNKRPSIIHRFEIKQATQ